MELKIPRFVVEAVFPNLAFNDAALSAAIRVDTAVLRYDVARETFIIRGGMRLSLSHAAVLLRICPCISSQYARDAHSRPTPPRLGPPPLPPP